jgi:hypothetical protein
MRHGLPGLVVLAGLALGACATQRGYEGATRPSAELGVIEGAPRVSAGLPISAVIRKVDERIVVLGYSKVAVVPGEHRVLVDCTVGATRVTTRHELKFEVYRGRRYGRVPESAPGNQSCAAVRVDER